MHGEPAGQRRDLQRRQQRAHARTGGVGGDEADAGTGLDEANVGDLVVGAQRELLAPQRHPHAREAAQDGLVAVVADEAVVLQQFAGIARRAVAREVAFVRHGGDRDVAELAHDQRALRRPHHAHGDVVYAVNPAYTRWDAELQPLFHQGLALAERLGARLMLPGNVYNYGAAMPACLTPSTPQRPTTRKGELRCAMEAELQRRSAAGLSAVVIRAGDFYGCGSGSWLDQAIARDLGRGAISYPGALDLEHAWAYLPDLARAFVAVASQAAAPRWQSLNLEGHTLTGRALVAAIEAAATDLGMRPPRGWRLRALPWGLMRIASPFAPMLRELLRMR